MNQTITIYHNPRCSKSRASLALLEASGLDVDIRAYLDSPPSPKELAELLSMLGTDIAGMLRTTEATFKALENPPPLSDTTAWLDIISVNSNPAAATHRDQERQGP